MSMGERRPHAHAAADPGRRQLLRCAACGLTLLFGLPRAEATLSDDGVGTLPALGDAAQGLLSPAAESRFGRRIMAELRAQPEYLDDVLLRDYLQGIVERLAPAAGATAEPDAPHSFDLSTLRDPSFNAFALPGGYICMYSGLVVDAQAEAQLAAVLAHEMSHITQRHIAQNLARAGTDSLISVGSMVLAVLAGIGGNGQAAQGLMMGGQAASIDRALAFSRNIERDADRVGTGVLRASDLPPQAMASMLERLQDMSRLDNAAVFEFLRNHPLNSERIADAQARGGNQPLAPDTSLRFWLMNARARVLSNPGNQDRRRLGEQFARPTQSLPTDCPAQRAAWDYGRALIWTDAGSHDKAQAALQDALAHADGFDAVEKIPLQLAQGDSLLARQQPQTALQLAQQLRELAPGSRAALHLQARALLAQSDKTPARDFLRQQTVLTPRDAQLWNWLAQACAATGASAEQHRATGEAYALHDNLEAAVLQLKIAQRTPGADYFDASIIDARLQAMQQQLQLDRALDKQLPQ
jgi:predicted Zn-dependent protease